VNLKELREEINAQLDYNPDLKQYRDIVSRVINRHYLQISSQYPWLFMQKKENLQLKADIAAATASASGSTLYIDRDNSNPRKVEFYAALSGGSALTTPTFLNKATTDGQTLVVTISGVDHEYLITQSEGLTDSMFVEPLFGSDELPLLLDADNGLARTTSWKIEYRKYPMPRDCVEILGVTSRADDKGRLVFIDAKKEELLHLDRDNTGDSIILVEEMVESDPAPPAAPVLTTSSATYDLTDGFPIFDSRVKSIQYCYTSVFAGRESAPSPVAEYTNDGSSSFGVQVTGMAYNDHLASAGTVADYASGRRKRLYRRIVLSDPTGGTAVGVPYQFDGSWMYIADITSGITHYTDFGQVGTHPDIDRYQLLNTLDEPGPRQYLRAYRTPDADKKVELRYAVRPTRMSADGDQPLWPGQYHHLLVYKVLEDLCLMHGMNSQAGTYERRAKELLKRMKDKYLSRIDRPYIRGSFERGMWGYRNRERWGTPSKA